MYSAEHDFIIGTKSSLDKQVFDMAAELSVSSGDRVLYADLDDPIQAQAVIDDESPAILWRFMSVDEDPRDPLYTITFTLGFKTSDDRSSYALLDFVGKVKQSFSIGTSLDIYDWSGDDVPTVKLGNMMFTDSGMDSQEAVANMGFRMIPIVAKAVRFPL